MQGCSMASMYGAYFFFSLPSPTLLGEEGKGYKTSAALLIIFSCLVPHIGMGLTLHRCILPPEAGGVAVGCKTFYFKSNR